MVSHISKVYKVERMNKSTKDQVEYQQASKITKKFDISITTLRRWNDQGTYHVFIE